MIKVLSEDIDYGVQGKADRCPIALAINRKFPGSKAFVSRTNVHLVLVSGENYFFHLPQTAINFIKSFDSFGDNYVGPFEFELIPWT